MTLKECELQIQRLIDSADKEINRIEKIYSVEFDKALRALNMNIDKLERESRGKIEQITKYQKNEKKKHSDINSIMQSTATLRKRYENDYNLVVIKLQREKESKINRVEVNLKTDVSGVKIRYQRELGK